MADIFSNRQDNFSNSSHYNPIELVSENIICQSWIAARRKSGNRCFVKVVSPTKNISISDAQKILLKSYNLQQHLNKKAFHTAKNKRIDKGQTYIEYDLLGTDWEKITDENFLNYGIELLTEVALLSDLLHIVGYIHRDLKIENILVRRQKTGFEIKLIDFDFLTTENYVTSNQIIGTPGYIAPEIIEGDDFTIKADIFSLGMSLLAIIKRLGWSRYSTQIGIKESILRQFLNSLTDRRRENRPGIILESLYNLGIITRHSLIRLLRILLIFKLHFHYRANVALISKGKMGLNRFLNDVCKLNGIHYEILIIIEENFANYPVWGTKTIYELINKSEVSIAGLCFNVEIPDSTYLKVFRNYYKVCKVKNKETILMENPVRENIKDYLVMCKKLFIERKYYQYYLFAKQIKLIKSYDASGNKDLFPYILMMAECSEHLGRIEEAKDLLLKLLDRCNNDLDKSKLYPLVIKHSIALGEFESAKKRIKEFLKLGNLADGADYAIERHLAWIDAVQANYSRGIARLEKILGTANKRGDLWQLTSIYVLFGAINQFEGKPSSASMHYDKAVKYIHKDTNINAIAAAYVNMIFLYFDLARYNKAIQLSKVALEYAKSLYDSSKYYNVCHNTAICYARVAKYRDADSWLNKMLHGRHTNTRKSFLSDYYLCKGFIDVTKGDINNAESSLSVAESLLDIKSPSITLGKVYLNRALISLYKSKCDLAQEYALKSKDMFHSLGNYAYECEAEFLLEASKLSKGDKSRLENVENLLSTLTDLNCYYYASRCLFLLLVYGRSVNPETYPDLHRILAKTPRNSPPLFKALNIILNENDSDVNIAKIGIGALKEAYGILYSTNQYYFAMQLSEMIADKYHSNGNIKLARKFYKQAGKIADLLENSKARRLFDGKLMNLAGFESSNSEVYKVLYKISDIFSNINMADKAADKLVEFAVELTGAERGVLLIRSGDSQDLHVKSYINCDNRSLDDIKAFSGRIPLAALDDFRPLMIDNAVNDYRTKDYKSIVAYNILSVLCIPIELSRNEMGVLYLDHHNFPALFDEEDLILAKAIAKFISSVVPSIAEYAGISESKSYVDEKLMRLGEGESHTFVTENLHMLDLLSELPSISGSNAEILLLGESGTGKEIICNLIHKLSKRSNKPLIKLNCAAISESIAESEIFGIVDGAATTVKGRPGKLLAADGGTLFFDEIGDIPLSVQSKILRAIENQAFEKVGDTRIQYTDIRFIFATNKNLKRMIKKGLFREDLYYRISTIVFKIPPLRERIDDVPILLNHFLKIFKHYGEIPPKITDEIMNVFLHYNWPGNVRELKKVIQNLYIKYPGKTITISNLPDELYESAITDKGKTQLLAESIECNRIKDLLRRNNWNQAKVARIMNVSPATIHRKIKKYNIKKNK